MNPSTEQQQRYIAIWAKAIDTQMHFNEMSAKSRQLGLTFVAAALGVGIVLLSRGDDFSFTANVYFFKFHIHVVVLLILGAQLALAAVEILDLNVYHKMLRGAVTFGEDFEENYMKQIFDLDKGMTQAISHFSRYSDASREITASGKYVYRGAHGESAQQKIEKFYKKARNFLWGAAAVLLLFTNLGVLDSGRPAHGQSNAGIPSAEDSGT